MRLRGLEVAACRLWFVAGEADFREDGKLITGCAKLLEVLGHDRESSKRVAPPAGLVKRLAKGSMRLRLPHHRAHLFGELPGPLCRGQSVIVAVQVEQSDGLVNLKQQSQIGQRRVSLGHSEPAV